MEQLPYAVSAAVVIASTLGSAAFVWWPDDGYGRWSPVRRRLRRSLLASWRWQWRVVQRWFGGRGVR